jgi:DNA polymerase-1
MRYQIVGGTGNAPEIAFLCPRIQVGEVEKYYYKPHLVTLAQDIMVCDIFLDRTKKKTSAAHIKEYLNEEIPELLARNIKLLVVTHPDYFKVLTKKSKTDATIGDVIETVVPGLFAAYCPNYGRVFYDPDKIKAKIALALGSVNRWMGGNNVSVGSNIIKYVQYLKTDDEIITWLNTLLEMDCDLTCDIEGFSLKHYNAGIGTITFCWNEHEGVAFPVDYQATTPTEDNPKTVGKCIPNSRIRAALRNFFEGYQRKMIYHNICYDVYVLIYQLFMDHLLDQKGLLKGLNVMLRNWDCSQLITYLATNSCAGNELGLKAQSQAFAGNYGQEDIHDITLIPLDQLLKYNLIDGLATWHVYKKHLPTMVADNQESVYLDIFKPAARDIIQMQLTGMPINMDKVVALEKLLQAESDTLFERMNNLKTVKDYLYILGDEMVVAKNLKLKKKQITRADLGLTKDTIIEFNPNSSLQLQRLLFSEDFLGLPVLDMTDTKLPATGADTLEKLLNHTKDPEVTELLNLLIEFKASAIILSTFLPAFLKAQKGNDGWYYLFGSFRLGGTASGRLSSANPNLQNIPSAGSTKIKQRLAKLIKECIEAPPGWLFVGLDFDSLEDKISAVTTRDPMKIKVYSDGYDGHCLRALAYFPEEMPEIELCPEDAYTYKAMIGDEAVLFHSGETIEYQGQTMTGAELVLLINNGK